MEVIMGTKRERMYRVDTIAYDNGWYRIYNVG